MQPLSQDECISRFITQSSHFTSSKGRVKYGAFMPPPNSDELSVCRSEGLNESEIWAIAKKYIEAVSKRNVKARADLLVGTIFSAASDVAGLDIDADGIPFDEHANITNWPSDPALKRQVATELAELSRLTTK